MGPIRKKQRSRYSNLAAFCSSAGITVGKTEQLSGGPQNQGSLYTGWSKKVSPNE